MNSKELAQLIFTPCINITVKLLSWNNLPKIRTQWKNSTGKSDFIPQKPYFLWFFYPSWDKFEGKSPTRALTLI